VEEVLRLMSPSWVHFTGATASAEVIMRLYAEHRFLYCAGDEDGPAVDEVGEMLVSRLAKMEKHAVPFLVTVFRRPRSTTRARYALAFDQMVTNLFEVPAATQAG
jgi:hypothetical protein